MPTSPGMAVVVGMLVLAVVGWMLLVLTFILAHAPEKTMAEIIRESR